jgi:hypothetical protein
VATRALIPLAGLAILLGACGSDDGAALTKGVPEGGPRPTVPTVTTAVFQGPPASAPSRPVCDLLAAADVARLLGNAVRAGTGDPKFCFWGTVVDGGTSADVTVGIPAQGRAAQACAVQKLSLPKESSQEEVPGVGTSAVWSYQQNAVLLQGTLVACFDNAVVRVGVTGERNQAALRQAAVAVAQAVRGRL